MARSLDSNIYGADDTKMAADVASDALDTSGWSIDMADYWGEVQDDRAIAKSNVGSESTGPTDPDTPVSGSSVLKGHRQGSLAGNYGDRESLRMPPQWKGNNAHKPGPKTSTDEGGGVKSPPPSNQTSSKTGRQRSPAYNNETA
jgi:hypothetical protein